MLLDVRHSPALAAPAGVVVALDQTGLSEGAPQHLLRVALGRPHRTIGPRKHQVRGTRIDRGLRYGASASDGNHVRVPAFRRVAVVGARHGDRPSLEVDVWLRETAELAEQLIADTIDKQNIVPGTLTLHADRGTSMRSKSVAQLLVDLDVTKTHSRPHVSDDNPYSEAQFKTLKYRPDFPARFGSIEDARTHCREFFHWYNTEHRHSGIGFMTPDIVHYGQSSAVTLQRAITLDAAFAAHPARFKGLTPQPPSVPAAVWINPPKKETTSPIITPNCSLNS